jgi:hypothetical protein
MHDGFPKMAVVVYEIGNKVYNKEIEWFSGFNIFLSAFWTEPLFYKMFAILATVVFP